MSHEKAGAPNAAGRRGEIAFGDLLLEQSLGPCFDWCDQGRACGSADSRYPRTMGASKVGLTALAKPVCGPRAV